MNYSFDKSDDCSTPLWRNLWKKEVIKPSHQFCAAKGWEPEKKVLSLADFINMQMLGFPNVGENEKLKVTEKSSERKKTGVGLGKEKIPMAFIEYALCSHLQPHEEISVR